MYTIEFEANIRNGLVKIPDEYRQLENRHAKIVLMVEDERASMVTEGAQVAAELDFTDTGIQAFSGRDGLDVQRIMRDEW